MTIAETYTFLKLPRRLEWEIRKLTYAHDELQASLLPSAIRYDKDVVQTSPEDRMPEATSKILELEKRIRLLDTRKVDTILAITTAIDQLQDAREATVLTAYYVSRIPMEKVAEQIRLSTQHTYRLRKSGVKHLSEFL